VTPALSRIRAIRGIEPWNSCWAADRRSPAAHLAGVSGSVEAGPR